MVIVLLGAKEAEAFFGNLKKARSIIIGGGCGCGARRCTHRYLNVMC
jgi:hypothetical protein